MKKCRKKQFFTLLEVMVSMGVFALLMLALMQFFSAAQTAWERSGGRAELFDSARVATQLLYNDLYASFYGDEYHEMGDAADKYIFYKMDETKSGANVTKVDLTFATMRAEGLTEVNYVWDATTLKLAVQELSETSADAVGSLGASGWVNYPSNNWINSIRAKTAAEIADNILLFEVKNYYYNNSEDPPNDSAKYRPPAMVFVTFVALSSAGYEKLETLMKAVKSSASESDICTAIRGFFTNMLKSGFASGEGDPVKPLDDDPSDYKSVAIPAKQILFDNVQFFKVMVPIERD